MARSGKGPPGGAQTQDNFGSLSHACLSGEIAPAGAPPAAPSACRTHGDSPSSPHRGCKRSIRAAEPDTVYAKVT